jgi:hypothetical protein
MRAIAQGDRDAFAIAVAVEGARLAGPMSPSVVGYSMDTPWSRASIAAGKPPLS